MNKIIIIAALLSYQMIAFAGDVKGTCVLHYKRQACPGQEGPSYSKCEPKGKAECDIPHEGELTEAECKDAASSKCSNSRPAETMTKEVTAKWTPKGGGDSKMFEAKCVEKFPKEYNACNSKK